MPSLDCPGLKSTRAQTRKSKAAAKADAALFAGLDESDPYKDEGQKCELHTYERRFNTRGEAILLQSGCKTELGVLKESSIEAALVLTRFYDISRELETTQLNINSPHIKAALREVVRSYPEVNINSSGAISIFGEPRCLFHYHSELEAYASMLQDQIAKDHVTFCLQYMAKSFHREILRYQNTMKDKDVIPGLEFQNLWMAFKPGALLYQKVNNVDVICRLKKMREEKHDNLPPFWRLKTEILMCKGNQLEYIYYEVKIPHFDGYRPLKELDIFPLEHHLQQDSIKASILQRGKKYVSLRGIHHCSYEGLAQVKSSFGEGLKSSMVRGRVMIDSEEPNDDVWEEELHYPADREPILPDAQDQVHLCDENLLICHYKIPAFELAKKRWGLFEVSNLRPVEYNKDAFAKLVLPTDTKKTLSALVRLQEGDSAHFDDLVVGKGKGLIILLHGPPGVGKTFTAESIADYSQRPLYSLGEMDCGRTDGSLEYSLNVALARASKWEAVVLMDEADVFMQERGATEYSRNEQVSVLLRILEYFEGTMFLTTNRVQTIDPAFKSRIHLSLTYPALSVTARSTLWETFILKGTEPHRPRWLSAKFLEGISRTEVNGREIKNIVRVAHALAASDKRPMQAIDVSQGLRSLNDFKIEFGKAVIKRRREEDLESPSSKKAKLSSCK